MDTSNRWLSMVCLKYIRCMLKDFFRIAFFLVELFKKIYILYNLLNYLMSLNIFSSSVVDFLFFYSNVSQPKILRIFFRDKFR